MRIAAAAAADSSIFSHDGRSTASCRMAVSSIVTKPRMPSVVCGSSRGWARISAMPMAPIAMRVLAAVRRARRMRPSSRSIGTAGCSCGRAMGRGIHVSFGRRRWRT